VADSALSSGDSATTHLIRCAECHELVPADRVRHREERVKVASRPAAPGDWRSGGPPIFRPPPHETHVVPGTRPGMSTEPLPHNAYAIERIPVCIDCLRRQRMGLYGVCGVAVACLLAAAVLYSHQEGPPSTQEVALQAPSASPSAPATAMPEATPSSAAESTGPPPIWAKAASSPTTASAPPPASAAQAAASDTAPRTSAPATATAEAAPAEPPVWKTDRNRSSRKVAKATPPTQRAVPSPNALALRKNGYAALEQRHYGEALTLLQQATTMGDAYAPLYLGQIFENGIGVPRDVGQASYWYGIAIDRGNAVALSAFNRMRVSPY